MSGSTPVPDYWDATKMVPIRGYRAIVTGATSGTGTVAARELARQGAHVIIACRNEEKGRATEKKLNEDIASSGNGGSIEFMQVDMSELKSVHAFVKKFRTPPYTLTSDGFELQFATNHLGHFVLTASLFPLLRASKNDARVVSMSSILHRAGGIDMNNISTPKELYSPMGVYAKTKLYNMLFIQELNRRLHDKNITNVKAVVAHPGYCDTSITRSAGSEGASWMMKLFSTLGEWFRFGQTPEMGALPMLYAANGKTVQSGDFYGPYGLMTRLGYPQYDLFTGWGYPALEQPSENGKSAKYGKWLWEESERLSQIKFTLN